MKDAAALGSRGMRLARLATVDVIAGVRLGSALEGRGSLDPDALRELVARRSTQAGPT
jgi:hypothetical protein